MYIVCCCCKSYLGWNPSTANWCLKSECYQILNAYIYLPLTRDTVQKQHKKDVNCLSTVKVTRPSFGTGNIAPTILNKCRAIVGQALLVIERHIIVPTCASNTICVLRQSSYHTSDKYAQHPNLTRSFLRCAPYDYWLKDQIAMTLLFSSNAFYVKLDVWRSDDKGLITFKWISSSHKNIRAVCHRSRMDKVGRIS